MAVASTGLAQQPETAPTALPFLRASVVSVEAANKLITDLGIPVPNLKTEVEGTFPFLGPDTVAADKPLGVIMLASDDDDPDEATIVAIPPAEGKVSADDLAKAGAKLLANHSGLIAIDDVTLRRTASYLFVKSGEPAALNGLMDTPFAGDYKQPGNLAVMSLNLAALRKGAPATYQTFMESLKEDTPTDGPIETAAGEMYATFLTGFIDSLERATVTVGREQELLQLKTWLAPVSIAAVKPAPRPVFPGGTVFQIHIVYPDAKAAGWMSGIVDKLPKEAFEPMSPEQATRAQALIKRMVNLYGGGRAVSVAMAMKGNNPLVYVVNQLSESLDYGGEVKAIAAEAGTLAKEMGEDETPMEVSTYKDGANSVVRLTFNDKEVRTYIDAIQAGEEGKFLWVTMSTDDGHHVAELAKLGMRGTSTALCAGILDLGAMLSAATEGGIPLPPNMVEDLRASFAGQGVSWTVQTSGEGNSGYLFVDMQVPVAVAKGIAKTIAGASEPHDEAMPLRPRIQQP
jgi:hypothetical protein